MSDTYDRVSEKKDQATLREKIRILADYVWVVQNEMNQDERSSYIFVAKPRVIAAEGEEWEGKVSAIKNTIEHSNKTVKDYIKKNVNTIQGDINTAVSKVSAVDEKVEALTTMVHNLVETVARVPGMGQNSNMGRRHSSFGAGIIRPKASTIRSKPPSREGT